MGLFDLFKKKPPTHEEKVALAHRCYKPEMVSMVFPGGTKQVSNIIVSLAKIYGVSLEPLTAKEYYDILTAYSDVLIRRTITNSSDEHIVVSLQVKHENYIKNAETAEKVLAFCKLNMSDSSFVLDSSEKMNLLENCSGSMSEDENLSVQNLDIQDDTDDEMYGLCMEKPIYTNGQDDTDDFLRQLKSALGEDIVWEKCETLDVEGIAGKVVVYNGSLPSGKSYKTVYVNEHGINANKKIPKGFTTAKSKPVATKEEPEEQLYFENAIEFAMYVKLYNKKNNVVWVSSDKYIELYKRGYQLFECRQFAKAIDVYKECLKLNPIGISARFELVECYLMSKQFALARRSLYDMKDFLHNDSLKAKFYRRVGFVAIEESSFQEAYACYRYSLKYENHPSVSHEMKYIESKAGMSVKRIDVEGTLAKHNVPII